MNSDDFIRETLELGDIFEKNMFDTSDMGIFNLDSPSFTPPITPALFQTSPIIQNNRIFNWQRPANLQIDTHFQSPPASPAIFQNSPFYDNAFFPSSLQSFSGFSTLTDISPSPRQEFTHFPDSLYEKRPEDVFTCPEPNCGKTFSKYYSLKSHGNCHRKDRPNLCGCGTGFQRKHDLTRHIKNSKDSKCCVVNAASARN